MFEKAVAVSEWAVKIVKDPFKAPEQKAQAAALAASAWTGALAAYDAALAASRAKRPKDAVPGGLTARTDRSHGAADGCCEPEANPPPPAPCGCYECAVWESR